MGKTLLRGLLVILMAVGLCGLYAPAPARAFIAGHWTDTPPTINGVPTFQEWGSAWVNTYTHYSVLFENDAQFVYILLDVTGETPGSPAAIGANENFSIFVDTDNDGVMESLYSLQAPAGYLLRATSTNGSTWSAGSPCASYAMAGFGSSPFLATPHRIYEIALRLSEIQALPGGSSRLNLVVQSANPGFIEAQYSYWLNYVPIAGIYIYNANASNGLSDWNSFYSILLANAGISLDSASMDFAANVDYSSYQVIVIADDTWGSSYTWGGPAAAVEAIRQSKKPVVGIGLGGMDFFGAMGLFLNHNNSWLWTDQKSVGPAASLHTAWSTPNSIPIASPLNLYTSAVNRYSIDVSAGGFPTKSMTLLGMDDNRPDDPHYSVIAQSANNTCYTLWGFRARPDLLTANGGKLLANLAWQPPCRPDVLFLQGSDDNLLIGMNFLLNAAGFPNQGAAATSASSVDYSGVQTILIGWDTMSAWSTQANADAVVSTHLPVVAMGAGGDWFLHYGGVPMSNSVSSALAPQNGANLIYPLQPIFLAPYPNGVLSSLGNSFDATAGVDTYLVHTSYMGVDAIPIGYFQTNNSYLSLASQSFHGACYELYGFNSYEANMTDVGKAMLLNMLAAPMCNYAVMLPLVIR